MLRPATPLIAAMRSAQLHKPVSSATIKVSVCEGYIKFLHTNTRLRASRGGARWGEVGRSPAR